MLVWQMPRNNEKVWRELGGATVAAVQLVMSSESADEVRRSGVTGTLARVWIRIVTFRIYRSASLGRTA